MNVLTNKATKSYEYLSRYSSIPFYYHSVDKKYVYGIGKQLNTEISHVIVPVTQDTTLDGLAYKYYGRPDYYWIIADFNRIQDPFIELYKHFSTLKIPSLAAIEYED